MQLLAKGKTLADALAKLKERQEAAAVQLETLKADKKSIVFGAPSLSNDQSSRKRQIQAMVIAQMRARGKKVPKGLLTPQTVTVSATLTAQWPLGAESHEKLLLLSQGIEEKIKAADLAGSKEAEKLSPEEEEFEEEASQMANQSGEEAQRPGQPQFMFVAELPKQERQKAMAAAFAKAKERAAELAKAADVELGPLVGLTGNCFAQSNIGDNPYARYAALAEAENGQFSPAIPQFGADTDGDPSVEKPDEALGADPSDLKFHCNVAAVFQLGK
jgi:lysophospholipase L1-like esterase